MTTRIHASRASAAGASTAAESTLRESTPPAEEPGLRVLFLDVDGVVCCNDQGILEPDKMGHLARIVRDSKCVVCLSTNWRLYDDLRAQLCEELAALNIECVGTTPDAGESQHQVPMRPCEIKAWVKEWNATARQRKRACVEQFVAVDDRPLIQETGGAFLKGHFVQTYPSIGLTERAAARITSIMLEPPPASDTRRGRNSPDSVLGEFAHLEPPSSAAAGGAGLRAGNALRPPPPDARSATVPPRRPPVSLAAAPTPTTTTTTPLYPGPLAAGSGGGGAGAPSATSAAGMPPIAGARGAAAAQRFGAAPTASPIPGAVPSPLAAAAASAAAAPPSASRAFGRPGMAASPVARFGSRDRAPIPSRPPAPFAPADSRDSFGSRDNYAYKGPLGSLRSPSLYPPKDLAPNPSYTRSAPPRRPTNLRAY